MASQDIALMAHLMRRAGFGATREELEIRVANGYEATVEEFLNPESQPAIDRYELVRYQPWTWRPGTIQGMGSAEWLHFMINTKRPLEEKMGALLAPGVRYRRVQGRPLRRDYSDGGVVPEKGHGQLQRIVARDCKKPGDDLLAG